ncbi:peptidoglycan DD-metalloendopeptidase family protein [Nocardioides ochotonae]|uniref:peptidoglycan DD-metalloendopeptidase family protein n=1 Tax=Nocardioides ochotonae TaxID=2685869 RepID=UPI00140A4DEA
MRIFPRASRSRMASFALAGALLAGSAAVPLAQAADDGLKQEQKKVEKQLDHAHDELEHSSARARRAAAALEASVAELTSARQVLDTARARVTAAKARDEQMRARLEVAEERLRVARAEVAAGQQAVADQRASVVDTVTSIYQEGDPEMLAVFSILEAQSPSDLMRGVEARKTVVGNETAAYDELRATEVLLQVRESRVEEARAEVAEQRREAAAHLRTMRGLHAEAREARAAVRTRVDARRAAQRTAYAAKARDQRVLDRLEQREERIRRQILAAAAKTRGGYRGDAGGFFDNPAPGGYLTSPYGYRKHPIYGYWGLHDGTDFGAACGTPMRAVADGTVASRYYSQVYGNRLHLNVGNVNGKYVTAVYNHATNYTVSPGQRVSRGQVIGYVGSTGWSTGCHLHFTVLVNGATANPMNYL